MVVGGVYTLWSMRKTIFTGLSKALIKKENKDEVLLRTEIDLPLDKVLMVCGILVGLTFLYYWWATGSLILALAGALFLGVVSFFFAAVAGYIAGVVGSSNSPVSGMTIATLLFTVALVWIVGDFFLGLATEELMLATLLIAAIVASSAAIAGDVMQDLKTGHMVGATPWRQQTAEIIGVVTGAVIIGPTLQLLHSAFRISKTACEMNPLPDDPTCSNALFAPQAELIGAIVQGAFGGDLNIQMVVLGAIIAVALIMLKMPVMSVAIGIYLPLGLSVPIMLGGIISYFALNSAYLRIDGHLDGKPSKAAEKAGKDVENRGVLIGAGFIAGESILGVFIAVLIVMNIKLDAIFGVTTLNDVFSLLFFGWFVAVFIWLATRALPKGGNLFSEAAFILKNITWKFFNAFKLKNLK
jgi:putative OPT family oligopeptide transporter